MQKCIFRRVFKSWVAEHPSPVGTIEFLGGALFGSFPQISYSYFLGFLYKQGYTIVTSVFRLGLNHGEISREIYSDRERVFNSLNCIHKELPRFWIGHSLGCKYIILLETMGEEENGTEFLLKDQPSILIAPDMSDTLDAVRFLPIAKYLDDKGSGVNPDRKATASLLTNSKRFNLSAVVSFGNDTIAGTQCETAEQPDFSDVALITEILSERPSGQLLKKEICNCEHLEPLGIPVTFHDNSVKIIDLNFKDGLFERVENRKLEPQILKYIELLKSKSINLGVNSTVSIGV